VRRFHLSFSEGRGGRGTEGDLKGQEGKVRSAAKSSTSQGKKKKKKEKKKKKKKKKKTLAWGRICETLTEETYPTLGGSLRGEERGYTRNEKREREK